MERSRYPDGTRDDTSTSQLMVDAHMNDKNNIILEVKDLKLHFPIYRGLIPAAWWAMSKPWMA